MSYTVSILQIGNDETVDEIDGFLAGLKGCVQVLGSIDDKAMALRVGGYRAEGQKPLVKERNPNNPGEDFARTHYSSMTFEFERGDEARKCHERFG